MDGLAGATNDTRDPAWLPPFLTSAYRAALRENLLHEQLRAHEDNAATLRSLDHLLARLGRIGVLPIAIVLLGGLL
ncbi:MAG TPA: hypothetical protein VKQ30_15815 [Ktedonobacterales bacterium]|nr:hypothetical protein [Ktedonobacterales bacterium]